MVNLLNSLPPNSGTLFSFSFLAPQSRIVWKKSTRAPTVESNVFHYPLLEYKKVFILIWTAENENLASILVKSGLISISTNSPIGYISKFANDLYIDLL